VLLGAVLALSLAACGGGGGGSAAAPVTPVAPVAPVTPANVAPVASAGNAQSVSTGAVTLDGSATDANLDVLTYAWTLSGKPAGSSAVLSNATAAKASFVADLPGVYTATLVVSDGKLSSAPASVTITASTPPVVTPPVITPATGTMGRALTPTMSADQSGCAAINYYDIGPGKTYTAMSQVPWSLLKGCDTVRIYPKPNNAAYNEMLLISAGSSATPTAANRYMRVIGVPDPLTGALPIIDGTNATQLETLPGQAPRSLQYHDNNSTVRSLYKLGVVMVSAQIGYQYSGGPPGYASIENLDIRNAAYNGAFTDGKTGTQGNYGAFTACLYIEAAAHLVVKNNQLHNCGNGLFINSKNAMLVELSQDILIDGNRIYNNGNAPIPNVSGGFSEHNSYTEVRGIIFQNNYFGDMRPGAGGDCLKDRSSGLVVRYNTFASNCTLPLHLLDATGGLALITAEADYNQTYVYGNLFDMKPPAGAEVNLVRYGGDSAIYTQYRQGTLSFYNNTMAVQGDPVSTTYPEIFLFTMQLSNAIADVRNNVFYTAPLTAGKTAKIYTVALGTGTVNLSNNWMAPNAAQFWLGHTTGAILNGWSSNIVTGANTLFAKPGGPDYTPAAGSPLINAGTALGTLAAPTGQPGAAATVRKQDGKIDIGAFEL
jgi:hypothetical protein